MLVFSGLKQFITSQLSVQPLPLYASAVPVRLLHRCSITDGQRMPGCPFSVTNILFFPGFASKLNPSLLTPRNAVKPSLAEILKRLRLWSLLQKPCRPSVWPPKANRLVAGKPTLQGKAFVPPQPLCWTDELLCLHAQSQNNELHHCTPDLLLYIMLLADPHQRLVTGEGHQALDSHCDPESV